MTQQLTITEIFASIQGESSYAGIPCTFVRLTGCPLRCNWCDTAYGFDGGQNLEINKVIEKVEALGLPVVEVTGGEPLAQKNAIPLMNSLLSKEYTVLLETGGSEPINNVPEGVHIVMDIKCPDSKMSDKNHWDNINHLKPTDEIKFVLATHGDFLWAKKTIEQYDLTNKANLLMSPAWGLCKAADLSSWIIEHKLDVRLNMQLHKHIWSPRAKGV